MVINVDEHLLRPSYLVSQAILVGLVNVVVFVHDYDVHLGHRLVQTIALVCVYAAIAGYYIMSMIIRCAIAVHHYLVA